MPCYDVDEITKWTCLFSVRNAITGGHEVDKYTFLLTSIQIFANGHSNFSFALIIQKIAWLLIQQPSSEAFSKLCHRDLIMSTCAIPTKLNKYLSHGDRPKGFLFWEIYPAANNQGKGACKCSILKLLFTWTINLQNVSLVPLYLL